MAMARTKDSGGAKPGYQLSSIYCSNNVLGHCNHMDLAGLIHCCSAGPGGQRQFKLGLTKINKFKDKIGKTIGCNSPEELWCVKE
ncbi:hypothetical protein EsDP_00001019 [Epichloe bromicola]|uniref:Uncharacterized protein n=1 Tax=Epichloe bromicola TaxID=79588 RepID=A0ABQ0CGL6_9HYPO